MSPQRKHALAALVLAATLMGLSAADPRGLRRYYRLQSEISTYAVKNRELAATNESLRREIRALSGDVRALERAAREELGLVKPNEVIFNFEP
jgi:cell division protein FtsB